MENTTNSSQRTGMTATEFGDFYHVARLIEVYSVPFICGIGLLGNTLSAITFLQKSLRSTSCSLYLAVRSISDNGFLLALLVIWTGGTIEYELNKVRFVCKVLLFLTYVCGSMSVWLVVFVTTENYLRICHPFIVKQWCTTRNAVIAMIGLLVAVLSLNHFPLWISDSQCFPCAEYSEITQAFVYIDTVSTLALPTIIMAFLIISILTRLLQHHKMTRKFNTTQKRSKVKANSYLAQVPKMLLAVSLTFLVLNLPSHVIRIRLLIGSFMKGSLNAPDTEAAIQIIAQLFYYLSLSVNVFIYFGFGTNFRRSFKETFRINGQNRKNLDEIAIKNLVPPQKTSAFDSSENGMISVPMLTGHTVISTYQ